MAKVSTSRSFGLSAADIKALQEQHAKDKRFPNPYRDGAYGFAVDALVALGVNKRHSLAKVHDKFKQLAGDAWYSVWASKESRNDKTGKDADGRFLQNLKVLQRTKDYGLKLLQAGRRILKTKGAVIDLTRDRKGDILVCLNTNSVKPQKPGRSVARVTETPAGKSGARAAKRKAATVTSEATETQVDAPSNG